MDDDLEYFISFPTPKPYIDQLNQSLSVSYPSPSEHQPPPLSPIGERVENDSNKFSHQPDVRLHLQLEDNINDEINGERRSENRSDGSNEVDFPYIS